MKHILISSHSNTFYLSQAPRHKLVNHSALSLWHHALIEPELFPKLKSEIIGYQETGHVEVVRGLGAAEMSVFWSTMPAEHLLEHFSLPLGEGLY